MKVMHLLVASVSLLAIGSAAYAAEGNGEPFPGPDAAVSEQMTPTPNYSMGTDAPFNYFYTAKPSQMTNYKQAPGGMDDPYPFKMTGQSVPSQPGNPNTYIGAPQPGPTSDYAHVPMPNSHG